MHSKIFILMSTGNTVFSFKEICLLWKEPDLNKAAVKIHNLVKKGELISLRRGIYSIKENFEAEEVPSKIYKPSYISLETILFKENIIFQEYLSVFSVSYLSREIEIKNKKYIFRKINNPILLNPLGIIKGKYSYATPERAILDTLFLNKEYYFDNLNSINWKFLLDISSIYANKKLTERIQKLYKNHN